MIDIFSIQPHEVSRDLRGYIIEIYGEPKTGKTTLATKCPGHLLLAFEKGYNALPGVIAQPINSWTDFLSVLNQLKKDEAKKTFENIIIDTADIAWDLCEKFVCQREQKAKIGDIPYGAGYAMVEKEFDERLRQIVQLDYGLFIISHSEEKNVKTLAGEETTKIGPTVNKRAAKVINRMADIIGYVKPITKRNEDTGEEITRSYMFMRGNSRFIAGSRFKYIAECIDFSYDNLVEAMHDAIDKEAKETGGKYVRDERINLYTEEDSGSTFKDVVDEFNLTAEDLMNKGVSPIEITKVIENVLGVGKMVKDCTEDQKSFVELINEKLKDLKV